MARKPTRRNQILELLTRYGVMSTPVLRELLDRKVGQRWLRQCLTTLKNRGLVACPTSGIRGSPVHYWMLTKEGASTCRITDHTLVEKEDFRFKNPKYTHYPHEDLCTLFQAGIERNLKDVLVLRESTNGFKLPKGLLSDQLRELGYTPDLCLGLPVSSANSQIGGRGYRWIAVEIDRTYRTTVRISRRVNVYTRHTGFSGLLYLMPTKGMVESLKNIYANRGAIVSQRIEGGMNTFLAAGSVPSQIIDVQNFQVSCGNTSISLARWIDLVGSVEMEKRDAKLPQFYSTEECFQSETVISPS